MDGVFASAWQAFFDDLSQVSAVSWAVTIAAASIAGLVRGFAGFGAGMIMVPSFSFAFNPLIAVVMLEFCDLTAQWQILRANWRSINWRKVMWLIAGTVITLPIGVLALKSLDPIILKRGYAIFILIVVVLMAIGWRYQGNGTPIKDTLVGLLAGFGSGAAGMGGPPVILYSLASSDSSASARGRIIGYLAISTFMTMFIFLAMNVMTWWSILLGLIAMPFYLIGTAIGQRIYPWASEQTYRKVALVLLAIIAILSLAATFWSA